MVKVAIFVEGQTELIFIREYLLKMYEHQEVEVKCFTFLREGNIKPTEYSFSPPEAAYSFEIFNVGNDNAVLSRLLKNEQHLWNTGFHKIFGVRDMYSKDYREVVKNASINEDINQRFQQSTLAVINAKAIRPQNIHFCYAIMEVEAWIIALKDCFLKLHPILNSNFISSKLGFEIDAVDPETTFFHPAATLEDIYKLVGLTYNKRKGDINAIMDNIQKQNFIDLANSNKCQSFKSMHTTFFPN